MKNRFIIWSLSILFCVVPVKADTMQHWAFIRDEYGNALGIASEGDGVTVTGWDANGRVQIYDCNTGISGTVAPVYLYGGSDYQYENPGVYSYEQPGTYDVYYQEHGYDYNYDSYYTGDPTYDPVPQSDQDYSYSYQAPVYQEPVCECGETASATYSTGTWVDIDISSQTMSVWKDGQQVLTG